MLERESGMISLYTRKDYGVWFGVACDRNVASYGLVARATGGSPRAVRRIMALNPSPLIVPRHRVVNSGFRPGGYGGSLDVKIEILRRKSRGYASKWEIKVSEEKLRLFPVELVLRKLKKGKC